MLENLRKSIGLFASKMMLRGKPETMQPMTKFFTGAKSVLVSLPNGYDDAIVASKALRQFRDAMNHVHLTVIHNSTRHTELVDYLHCEVVRIDPPEINWFFLPRPSLLGRIPKREFDVALDMNLDFVLHSAYICKASGARVRVGFSHPDAESFYNVQINIAGPRTAENLYAKFADILNQF